MSNQTNSPITPQPGSKPVEPQANAGIYSVEVREKLQKINSKIQSMKDESLRLSGDDKKKAEEAFGRLSTKYTELKSKSDGLRTATDEKWNSEKPSFDKSFEDLNATYKCCA